jgi:murein DD-endopeptidase MepM/ murein hydrolase activator NlpD
MVAGYFIYRDRSVGRLANPSRLALWLRDPAAHSAWNVPAGQRCGDAPFIFPTQGFVGFVWDDSFRIGHRHQGIDVFGGKPVGEEPVIAAYPGYLTRLPDWKSTVIIRIPDDPLNPQRQIWTYYTHMADPNGESYISLEFPPGTYDRYIEAGTVLGYQGSYSGDPNNPTGVHLHFSVVKDDGNGGFMNELEIENTLDPSPYLGMELNAQINQGQVPVCQE